MVAFDASSMIHAWDNYPYEQFPPLWEWVTDQIGADEFVIPQIAFEEVEKKSSECSSILKEAGITQVRVSNAILQEAVRIKGILGIEGENYHPNGVGENDILIIATAAIKGFELVSDEKRQLQMPSENRRLKIPAVCQISEIGVNCMSFIKLIRRSEEVFR